MFVVRRYKLRQRIKYDELLKRDNVNLDLFWLKDESLKDAEELPKPSVLAQEIADDLEEARSKSRP
jgi:type I restriction enzyme M protein